MLASWKQTRKLLQHVRQVLFKLIYFLQWRLNPQGHSTKELFILRQGLKKLPRKTANLQSAILLHIFPNHWDYRVHHHTQIDIYF